MGFRINWDNGASACGTFPYVFETEADAREFGENWVLEMTTTTPELMDIEGEGYSYEVFEEKPFVEPTNKLYEDWRDKAVTDEYDEK